MSVEVPESIRSENIRNNGVAYNDKVTLRNIPGRLSVTDSVLCTGEVFAELDDVIKAYEAPAEKITDSLGGGKCGDFLVSCDSVIRDEVFRGDEACDGPGDQVGSGSLNACDKEMNGHSGTDDVEEEQERKDSDTEEQSVNCDRKAGVGVILRRSAASLANRLSESSSRGTSEDEDDDEDAGVYAETHRFSQWICAADDEDTSSADATEPEAENDTNSDTFEDEVSVPNDEDDLSRPPHRRFESQCSFESLSSTTSFKYQHVSRKVVKRKSSCQAYERMSERFCEPEHEVVLTRESRDQDFGFHIKGTEPAYISTVVEGSIADLAGVSAGQLILSANGINCMGATHDEVLDLLLKDPNRIVLELAKSSIHPMRRPDEPILMGYLMKQCGTGLFKTWRKRYFVLKADHYLYYYKTEQETDPIGAIFLYNFMISKVSENIGRKFAFKAAKYHAKSYYFAAESESEMIEWANALNEQAKSAAAPGTGLDISSPNVDVPALSIKCPDCHGNLCKFASRTRQWRRRYCVLKDACIYYYLDVNATTAQGVAHLHGYTVQDGSSHSRRFTFTLQPPEERMRTFYFCADNETELSRWTSALRKSIARWVKTS